MTFSVIEEEGGLQLVCIQMQRSFQQCRRKDIRDLLVLVFFISIILFSQSRQLTDQIMFQGQRIGGISLVDADDLFYGTVQVEVVDISS